MEFHEDREDGEGEEEDEDNGHELDDEIMPVAPMYHNSVSVSNPTWLADQESTLSVPKPIRYRECRKNHALGIGGHAVDGCGEFMASGAEGTLDALVCAACNCHRNFHRKESLTNSYQLSIVDRAAGRVGVGVGPPGYRDPPPPAGWFQVLVGPPPPQYNPRPLALPPLSTAGFPMDLQDEAWNNHITDGGGGSSGSARKRFRTKFSQEQKDEMLNLAEKLGWRIQKHDEAEVDRFCIETGIKRQVLKVWMHNNKHTLGKKP